MKARIKTTEELMNTQTVCDHLEFFEEDRRISRRRVYKHERGLIYNVRDKGELDSLLDVDNLRLRINNKAISCFIEE